ncbi:ribonuclease III domain protein [Burkholderia pseudomallei]|nr:ribonuclease III domain protein [Burkholderia pseudomallei]
MLPNYFKNRRQHRLVTPFRARSRFPSEAAPALYSCPCPYPSWKAGCAMNFAMRNYCARL